MMAKVASCAMSRMSRCIADVSSRRAQALAIAQFELARAAKQ
jgi:hypothetical protein